MKATRTASITFVRPLRRARAASATWLEMPMLRRKSLPVPAGKMPSSDSDPESMIPLATSEIVPSPPQAMISFVPLLAASAESVRAWPMLFVSSTANGPKCVRRSLAIFGQFSRVAPSADAGLTMTRGRVIEGDLTTEDTEEKLNGHKKAQETQKEITKGEST